MMTSTTFIDTDTSAGTGVQPAILRWARETIGFTIEEASRRLKRPVEYLEAWEEGVTSPTYPQLEALATLYKRPVALFFLPAPPEEMPPIREFRTLPNADLRNLEPDTRYQIRRGHAFQITLRELFDHNPSPACIWRNVILSVSDAISEQAARVRTFLGVDMARQAAWRGEDTALKQWRQAIEKAGVFIFKAPFKQKDISGFCLTDDEFPIIVLNNSTTKTRQCFSLLHELAHILLRVVGISKQDNQYIDHLPAPEREIERFCNAIAAEVLMPSEDFAQQIAELPANAEHASDRLLSQIASRYGVSREAVLRRLLDLDRVSAAYYGRKAAQWSAQVSGNGGGGDWYASQRTYLSDLFAREVVRRQYKQQISVEQAAAYLGIKASNYAGLEQLITGGNGG